MSILSVSNIEAHYGDLQALFGISLSIDPGQVHSVIGANGAGKSTLLKVIAGNLPASSGEVTYQNKKINNQSAHERVKSGIFKLI